MALNFLSLLQGMPGAAGQPDAEEVLVQANTPASASLGNRSYLEEAQEAAAGAPQRQGMFGTRGTLRDVLGTIGDAFLLQAGNNPIYRAKRQQERESDALTGFTEDPMKAIERLAYVNGPSAQELYTDTLRSQMDQARTNATLRESDHEIADALNERAARILGSVDEASYPAVRQQIMKLFDSRGVTPYFDLPEQYDESFLTSLRQTGVPVKDQLAQEGLARYRADTIQQRRDADETRRAYYQGRLRQGAETNAERGRSNRAKEAIAKQTADARTTSAEAAKTRADKYQPGGGRGAIQKPTEGTRRAIMRNGQVVRQIYQNGKFQDIK